MEAIKVRLKNRVLKVPAEDKEKYLQQGYTVYDMAGNLIAEPATDANKLKGAKAEIASLTEQLKAAKEATETREKKLESLKAELSAAKEDVAAKEAEIASLTEQLKAAQKEVTAAKASAKAAAKTTAKDTEKTGK